MSLFDSGCDDGVTPYKRAARDGLGGVGFVRYGVDDVREKMADVRDFMRSTDAIVVDQSKMAPQNFVAKWQQLYADWSKFYDRFNGWRGVLSQMRDSTYERADAYQRAGQRFRDATVNKRYLEYVLPNRKGPSPATPAKPRYPDLDPGPGVSLNPVDSGVSLIPWRKILIGAGVVGGAYFAYRFFKGTPQGKVLAAPPTMVHNPPGWVLDPEIWESAKLAVNPYKTQYDNPMTVTVHVYKQLGGRMGTGGKEWGPVNTRYNAKFERYNPED